MPPCTHRLLAWVLRSSLRRCAMQRCSTRHTLPRRLPNHRYSVPCIMLTHASPSDGLVTLLKTHTHPHFWHTLLRWRHIAPCPADSTTTATVSPASCSSHASPSDGLVTLLKTHTQPHFWYTLLCWRHVARRLAKLDVARLAKLDVVRLANSTSHVLLNSTSHDVLLTRRLTSC